MKRKLGPKKNLKTKRGSERRGREMQERERLEMTSAEREISSFWFGEHLGGEMKTGRS